MEQTLTKGSLKGLRKGQGSFFLRVRQEGRQPEEQTKARGGKAISGQPSPQTETWQTSPSAVSQSILSTFLKSSQVPKPSTPLLCTDGCSEGLKL